MLQLNWFLFSLVFVYTYVFSNALMCIQGNHSSFTETGFSLGTDLRSLPCPSDDEYSCYRSDTVIKNANFEITTIVALCRLKTICSTLDCETIKADFSSIGTGSIGTPAEVTVCHVACCNTENCNNVSASEINSSTRRGASIPLLIAMFAIIRSLLWFLDS